MTGRVTYDFVPATYAPATGSGTLDFAQATVRPVRNAEVRVQSGTTVVATTTTADDGSYQVRFPSVAGLQLLVLAKTTSPPIQVEDNTASNAIWALGAPLSGASQTVDVHATHGWTGSSYDASRRKAAPFAVLDSVYTASKAFMAVRSVTFPLLKVNWSPGNVPQQGVVSAGRIGTTHFSKSANEVFVLGAAGADADEFDAHVVVHEWGHFFEFNLARADSPGGRHDFGELLDPRLAFGEGWGDALPSMVLSNTTYVDTGWSQGSLVGFGFDVETPPTPSDDPAPGVFSEASVMRLLYDLYDSTSDGPFDQVALGLGPIYDVLTGPQKNTQAFTTLGSFVTGLRAQPGVNAAALDALLAHYQVGPITSDFGDGDSNLRGMYTTVSALPWSGAVTLTGGFPTTARQQLQYLVFTGPGVPVQVTATCPQDVRITAYQKGNLQGFADSSLTGTEQFTMNFTLAGAPHIVVVTGFGATAGPYSVSMSIQ